MSRRATPHPITVGAEEIEGDPGSAQERPASKLNRRQLRQWLFLVCAWLCYARYMVSSPAFGPLPATHTTLSMDRFDGRVVPFAMPVQGRAADGRGAVAIAPVGAAAPPARGVDLLMDELPGFETLAGRDAQSAATARVTASVPDGNTASVGGGEEDDDKGSGAALPMIGATMALSGKCAAPDYGTRLFYIKNKHTRSGTLAGILRRIGALHSMAVADPPKGRSSFASDADFHRVAQGRCVDMLVAHTVRAPWLDKAFKGALKITSVRDPLHRALSALDHSVACGAHCSTCFKLVKDPVAWARRCAEVGDAQFELVRGRLDNPEAAVDDYDLVLVADRYFESLVVLRHVLGVALAEVLFLSKGDADPPPVSLAGRPPQLLDVLTRRNVLDRRLHDAASAALDEKIRIIGRGAVRREASELKAMQGLVQRACGDQASDLMGPGYAAAKDCQWRDQGCGHRCIVRWASMYQAARLTRSEPGGHVPGL